VKFLCDEMLQRLGRWLRAAGYDTVIETQGRRDYELLKQALAEQRYLITRDRELNEYRRAPGTVILLECERLDDCVAELGRHLDINWLHQPFVRCMVCNTPLTDSRPQNLDALPERLKASLDTAFYCPACQKVYWEGSHVNRMRRQLEAWRDGCSNN